MKYLTAHPDVVLLSDEVYEKIIFDGNRHISPASFPEIAERVITINGFSKCAAMTGWRLGYACASDPIMKRMVSLWQHMMTCTSGFIQDGGVAALDCHEEMEEMRRCYDERRKAFIDALNQIPHVTCKYPEGAFYAWVKFNIPGKNSYEICDYLLEEAPRCRCSRRCLRFRRFPVYALLIRQLHGRSDGGGCKNQNRS